MITVHNYAQIPAINAVLMGPLPLPCQNERVLRQRPVPAKWTSALPHSAILHEHGPQPPSVNDQVTVPSTIALRPGAASRLEVAFRPLLAGEAVTTTPAQNNVIWGKVVSTDTGFAELNIGSKDGLRKSDIIFLYRPDEGNRLIDQDKAIVVQVDHSLTHFKPHTAKVGDLVAFRKIGRETETAAAKDSRRMVPAARARTFAEENIHKQEVLNERCKLYVSNESGYTIDFGFIYPIFYNKFSCKYKYNERSISLESEQSMCVDESVSRWLRYTVSSEPVTKRVEVLIPEGKKVHEISIYNTVFNESEKKEIAAFKKEKAAAIARREAEKQEREEKLIMGAAGLLLA